LLEFLKPSRLPRFLANGIIRNVACCLGRCSWSRRPLNPRPTPSSYCICVVDLCTCVSPGEGGRACGRDGGGGGRRGCHGGRGGGCCCCCGGFDAATVWEEMPRAIGIGRYRSVSRDLEEAAPKKPLPPPPKPELPPSSQGLDLGGLPVLDVFHVYSCLRSFSKQLFLSPFSLETFVAALRSTYVNPLIGWVHFTLLRALKSHLEDSANEGDPSAVHCIRYHVLCCILSLETSM
jgi:hypothetical protein